MMITKDDIVRILEDNYKSQFDDASMDMLVSLTPIIVCACEDNVDVKNGAFLTATLESIGIAWAIYALQSRHSDRRRVKVRSFLECAKNLRRQGFEHFAQAENIIRTHLTDV